MKKHNPKMWLACGQHVNASDDNCPDLKRHSFTEYELAQMKKTRCNGKTREPQP